MEKNKCSEHLAKSRLGIEAVHLKFCITPFSVARQLFCVVIFFTQNSANVNKTTGSTVLPHGQFVGIILFCLVFLNHLPQANFLQTLF